MTQWYDPEPGPAAIPGVLAREFAAAGHEVRVLTGFPNYPTGRVYPGHRQTWRRTSTVDGVTVTRVPLYASHDSSAVGRALNYLSFAVSATVLGRRSLRGCDMVWVYNSPATVALPLLVHTRWGRLPYFLHVQDLWPDSLVHSGMFPEGRAGRLALVVVSKTVSLTERLARKVGVISPSVSDLIQGRNPDVGPDDIVYVPNPTDEGLFTFSEVRERRDGEPFVLMYSGAIGDVQGLDSVVEAVASLPSDVDLRLVLVGDGIALDRLKAFAARVDDAGRIEFVGRVPKERVPGLMQEAHAHLVSLGASEFLEHTTPSKIPSLLASGAVVLGVIAGDGARLITESGAGTVVSPADTDALQTALVSLSRLTTDDLRDRGRSGRRHYDAYFSAGQAAAAIIEAVHPTFTHQQVTKDLS
ncbi:glycosyltransferase family 4 protein [Frigoribacterium faeni]|uniref:glycosyltransferase family 4 protein n=1 Tax=Frigoribacterium faeni TaxID=145483 RepID=UPI0024134B85|nr:glycosyltransferase family 4 protein [Frigoribacterium faeni]